MGDKGGAWAGKVDDRAQAKADANGLDVLAATLEARRQGVGGSLVATLAGRLRVSGGRVLLVEISSLDDYVGTRRFYAGLGFVEEARIRDFYTEGEDKIVFWKRL